MKMLRKGFTLIELLVVIAIIGILATIIIINVAGARTKAVDTKAFTDLSGATKIGAICLTDNGIVSAPDSAGNICTVTTVATGSWPILTTSNGYGTFVYGLSTANTASTATNLNFGLSVNDGGTAGAEGSLKIITCTAAGCLKSGSNTTW